MDVGVVACYLLAAGCKAGKECLWGLFVAGPGLKSFCSVS